MKKSYYIYRPEGEYPPKQAIDGKIGINEENNIIRAMEDVRNRDIQIGILKMGRIEKSLK